MPNGNESIADFLQLLGIFWPRFVLAIVAGAVIGLENQIFGKAAGLRTCILVTLGAAIMTIVSIISGVALHDSPTRITAQIITGIGFIGGGVILRNRGRVTGITTAATIFVCAGIGMTIGSGYIYTGLAISLVAGLILLSLWPVDRALDKYPAITRLRKHEAQREHFGTSRVRRSTQRKTEEGAPPL